MTKSQLFAVPFLLLWLGFAVLNAASLYRTHVSGKYSSPIPLLGGVIGLIGFLQVPELKPWCWLAVLADYGSIAFLYALPKVVNELWQTSRVNLVHEFVGTRDGKEVRIRLYRAGVFVVRHDFTRSKHEAGLLSSSDIGNWVEAEGDILLTLQGDTLPLRRSGDIWGVDRSFRHYEKGGELEMHHLSFILTK